MDRRLPSARVRTLIPVIPIFVALLVAVAGVAISSRDAVAEDSPGVVVIQHRPILEDPEIGLPGDDDQPTITGRKRESRVASNVPGGAKPDAGVRTEPRRRQMLMHWIEDLRARLGRLGQMLR
jgi:hypothetical protein